MILEPTQYKNEKSNFFQPVKKHEYNELTYEIDDLEE